MTHSAYLAFLFGALVAMSLLAGLFFLRYWYLTRDRFFIGFACAFWTFAVNWGLLAYDAGAAGAADHVHYIYAVRLFGFIQIIAAILMKNRRSE